MDRDSTILLKNNLTNFIRSVLKVDFNLSSKFLIEFDETEKVDLSKEQRGRMLYFLLITNTKDKQINLAEVSELLTTSRNEIPLWIKVIQVEKSQTYKLIISKRFRKKIVAEEWHKNSALYPFIK